MKNWFTQVCGFLMAIMVVLSTLSFSVHKHYCGSFLIDTSIILPSQGCGMEMNKSSSCNTFEKSKCCNDDSELVEGQDELKTPVDHIIILKGAAFITNSLQDSNEFNGYEFTAIHLKKYQPPLVLHDIPVMHQSFLL